MYFNGRRTGISSLALKLMLGTAFSTVAVFAAQAQDKSAETVVVTGTSIRGSAPIGSSLQSVGLDAIQDTKAPTLQSLLADLPEMGNFGTSAVGNQNSDRGGGFSPTIHNIGAGSSIATLTLINGHRIPTTGLTESNSDPTIIASSALQRVDILPDGASATYGSDAVAGVANFITRQNFRGLETNLQTGIASNYSTFNGSILFGNSWDSGNVMVAYDYSGKSELANMNRKFVTARQDIRLGAMADTSQFSGISAIPAAALTVTPAAGPGTTGPYGVAVPYPSMGQNFQNFACPVATIATNSSSANAFYYQPGGGYGGTGYAVTTANTNGNGACDNLIYGTLIPSETRNNLFVQVKQEITDDISIESTFSASTRMSTQQLARGTLQATAFGPTAGTAGALGTTTATIAAAAAGQVNPFYVGNATTGNSAELIRYDFDALLGRGAYDKVSVHDAFTTQDLTWDLGNGREIAVGAVAGININQERQTGVVGASGGQPLSSGVGQALLALNGSTAASGAISNSISDPFGLGTVYPGSRVLTTLNALDVWTPAGAGNRTSATVIRSLKDSQASQTSNQAMQDLKGQFDGPIFDLPAGPVKVAVGGEYLHQTMTEFGSNATSSGTASTTSQVFAYNTGRTVYSAYAEASVPVVSPEMGVPLMQSFALDFAGRYDKYSDFGDTENPKVSFDWVIADGLKFRGSYGTSFVAPGIHDALGTNSQSIITAAGTPTNNTILFNTPNTYNGGAGTAGTWVADPTNCAAGGGTVVNSAGTAVTGPAFTGAVGCQVKFGATTGGGTSAAFQIAGGHLGLLPAHGRSFNLGVDLDAGKLLGLDGLVANITWWQFTYLGLVTGGSAVHPSLTFFAPPGGWTATSPYMQGFTANRSLSLSVPAQIWATVDNRLNNSYDIWMNGLDYTISYNYVTQDMGTFKFSTRGTELLRMSQSPHVIGGVTAEAAVVDVKDGKNSPRYGNAAPEWQFRATGGWQGEDLGVTLGFNFIHPQDGTDTSFPYSLLSTLTTGGRGYTLPNGTFLSANQTHIGALAVFDLLINYDVPQGFLGLPEKLSSGTQLSLKIDNLLDTNPPFNPNSSSGFSIGNPVGRMATIGIRKKF